MRVGVKPVLLMGRGGRGRGHTGASDEVSKPRTVDVGGRAHGEDALETTETALGGVDLLPAVHVRLVQVLVNLLTTTRASTHACKGQSPSPRFSTGTGREDEPACGT